MDPVRAPGVYQGVANVIAAVMLLIEFGMLRQALARDQVRLSAVVKMNRRLSASRPSGSGTGTARSARSARRSSRSAVSTGATCEPEL